MSKFVLPKPLAILAAAGALLIAAAQPALAADASPDQNAIERSFRDWQQALVDRDRGTLERIAAPEFTQDQVGSEESRAVAIGMPTLSPDYAVNGVKIETMDVKVAGDSGQLQAIAWVQESYSGRTYTSRLAFSQSWIRRDGQWLLMRSDNTIAD